MAKINSDWLNLKFKKEKLNNIDYLLNKKNSRTMNTMEYGNIKTSTDFYYKNISDSNSDRIVWSKDLNFLSNTTIMESYVYQIYLHVYEYLIVRKLNAYCAVQSIFFDKYERFKFEGDYLMIIDKKNNLIHFFCKDRDYLDDLIVEKEFFSRPRNLWFNSRKYLYAMDWYDIDLLRIISFILFDDQICEWRMKPFEYRLYMGIEHYYFNYIRFLDYYNINNNLYYFKSIFDLKSRNYDYFGLFFFWVGYSEELIIDSLIKYYFNLIKSNKLLKDFNLDYYYYHCYFFLTDPFLQFEFFRFYLDIEIIDYSFFLENCKLFKLGVNKFAYISIFLILFHDFFVFLPKPIELLFDYEDEKLRMWYIYLFVIFDKYICHIWIIILCIQLYYSNLFYYTFPIKNIFIINYDIGMFMLSRYFAVHYDVIIKTKKYRSLDIYLNRLII